jgi:hypothetical protein
MQLTKEKLTLVDLLFAFTLKRADEIRTFVNEHLQPFLIEIFIRDIGNLGRWRREPRKKSIRAVARYCTDEHASVRNETDSRELEGSHDLNGNSGR